MQAGEENPNPQRNPQWRKGKPKTRAKRRSSEKVKEERREQKETETRKKKGVSFYSAASYYLRSARKEGNQTIVEQTQGRAPFLLPRLAAGRRPSSRIRRAATSEEGSLTGAVAVAVAASVPCRAAVEPRSARAWAVVLL